MVIFKNLSFLFKIFSSKILEIRFNVAILSNAERACI